MLDRLQLERWLFGSGPGQRHTQDSPILPDVWYAYGLPPAELRSARPEERPLVAPEPDADAAAEPPRHGPAWEVDLLLRPNAGAEATALARELDRRLDRPRDATRLAFNDGYVACRLTFDELLQRALPLTRYWQAKLWPGQSGPLAGLVQAHRHEIERAFGPGAHRRQGRRPVKQGDIPGDVVWLVGLVGRIAWEHRAGKDAAADGLPTAREVVDAAIEVIGPAEVGRTSASADPLLWSVSRNRPVETSVWRSRIACKADAATRVFGLSCRDVRWAVIDSGVDARHPAFARRPGEEPLTVNGLDPADSAGSRIVGTWDFAAIRDVLATLPLDDEPAAAPPADAAPAGALTIPDPQSDPAERIREWVGRGRAVDWRRIGVLLEIHHDAGYRPPKDDHGTHVAGILAADWRSDDRPTAGEHDVRGMCPDMQLYDLRTFDASGSSDEFQILSAMQFVRFLNANADVPVIHGVNLSFSVRHEVDRYAAGATPVCEEAHRLVGSGVVVVAAAGNDGRGGYVVKGRSVDGYRSVSITDPGNAEKVITVGATHRDRPHTYGVSYFSSRGPTGDGRAKPDLVAPGEKITAPVPELGLQSKDGTSQAAPHVSGACALLMARHPELMGQPDRIKQILLDSCTDLGRAPSFQGAGVVDILRAIQSV